VFYDFPICGKFAIKVGSQSDCDCVGLIKNDLGGDEKQCIGYRKKCYENVENEKQGFGFEMKEVFCQEMDAKGWMTRFEDLCRKNPKPLTSCPRSLSPATEMGYYFDYKERECKLGEFCRNYESALFGSIEECENQCRK